jgi:hypothetical protein
LYFTFPAALSQEWTRQGIYAPGSSRPLQLLDRLSPAFLPCFVSRGPRVGGFLHPTCYGVPGTNDTTKASRQPVYVPTTVLADDGLVLTESYAAAYYRGRTASYLAGGGMANPVRAFPTQAAAKHY